jgi:hypothetical protein
MSYNFNFTDLSRFMDDFTYLIQKGGRFNKIFSEKTKNILERVIYWFVLIVKFILIIIAIYVLYIILFKGYPRLIVNLIMFKFSNKENLDRFLQEHKLMTTSMKALNNIDAINLYNEIFTPCNVLTYIKEFEDTMNTYYFKYQYDEKYFHAFKEYYLFFNKIEDKKIETRVFNNTKFNVEKPAFYEILITYKTKIGEIDSTGKGEDQLFFETIKKEDDKLKNNEPKIVDTLHKIKQSLINLGKELQNIIKNSLNTPIIPYILLPNEALVTQTQTQIESHITEINSGKVYEKSSSSFNDFTWIALEYLSSTINNNQYATLTKAVPSYSLKEYNKIVFYLTLPREKKTKAEIRLMESNVTLYEFVKKYPLFSLIHFSNHIKEKEQLYNAIMKTYYVISNKYVLPLNPIYVTDLLANINKNGKLLKAFITNASVMHLFITEYQPQMTKMYEKQVISTTRFFKELWTPFLTDIVINRIGTKFKTTFSSEGFGSSWSRFKVKWDELGDNLKNMITAVFKAFFTSVPIEKPQEPPVEDGQDLDNME